MGEIKVTSIKSEEYDQNCYLITKEGKGLLIDPGPDTDKIKKAIEGIEVNYIFLTHCHYDHIWSVNALKEGRTIICPTICLWNMENPRISLCDPEHVPVDFKTESVVNDRVREYDGINVGCFYTPGHTDDSVCYLTDVGVFTGDTLFRGNVGRWDLPSGNFDNLKNSVQMLCDIQWNLDVYPGHGPKSTIEEERKNNYFGEEDL